MELVVELLRHEKFVEFFTGAVKGLLIFGIKWVTYQRSAFLINGIDHQILGGEFTYRLIPVDASDNLSAQDPEVIDMALEGAFGKALLDQVLDRGRQDSDNGFSMLRSGWSIIQLSGHASRSGT